MKTKRIFLMSLWGALAATSPLLLAGQNANLQPVNGASPATFSSAKDNSANNAPKLSWGLDEIAKLSKAGVDESVILAFVKNANVGYNPTAQDVIQLRELGVSSQVTTALMQRGSEVRQTATIEAQKQVQAVAPVPAQPAPVYAAPATYVAPASTVTYIGYPRYDYTYGGYFAPTYNSYPYYPWDYGYYGGFYPRVSFGVNFGHVGFRGGHAGFGGFNPGFHGGFGHHGGSGHHGGFGHRR